MEFRPKTEDPPLTDLNHYSRPENYAGSNINTLTKFLIAKDKEAPKAKNTVKKKKNDSEERKLFKRYRHILSPGYTKKTSTSSSSSSETSDSDESDDETNSNNRNISNSKSHRKSKSKTHTKTLNKEVTFQDFDNGVVDSDVNSQDNLDEKGDDDSDDSSSQSRVHPERLSNSSTDSGIKTMDEYAQGNQETGDEMGPKTLSARKSYPSTDSPSLLLDTRASVGNMSGLARKMGLARMMTVKNRLAQLSKTARRRMYFRRITVGIINVLKLAKAIIKPTDSPNALLMSFTALSTAEEKPVEDSENMRNYGLHFDPSYFKANKEISVTNEVKNILSLPPYRRTPDLIQTAIFGLQSLSSFAEYPLHIQEKLARVAWYEIVTPMRTIIRQGHFAENFYFILSGKALVTLHLETGTKTAGMMKKGTSFGELALLHHSRRTATVTSHDTVQLLSIGREDFFNIFMSRQSSGEMPDHIKFVTQLDFMKDWPVDRLLERPDQCLLLFFKRNTVIQKDSKTSDWFYIIKSGSCQVLKELKGVTARGTHDKHTDGPEYSYHFKHRRNQKNSENEDDNKNSSTSNNFGKAFSKLHYSNSQAKPHFVSNRNQVSPDHKPIQAGSVFIQMGILKPKDVFGLDCVHFDNTEENKSSSVILVSLGAECIMLSKSFFMKNANDRVKKHVSEIVSPYPDEVSMQQSLQNKADWEYYKQSLITKMAVDKPTGLRNQPLVTQW